ncbi:hypothetical protein T05_9706 [Trichinella murrelli]|uniref:Uncharacterized protein n=1 Tax=Trichinella murrelli TaxID=144512 RepID=A0A0V0TL21_9BILA|nr:hypothetical protein T05_9706 [Trichinella murrelli]
MNQFSRKRSYPSLLDSVVLSCSFAHAAVPTVQMVVDPLRHTMNVPKLNFCGRKPLLLEILEQGFQLTRRPNIYDFKTSGYKNRKQITPDQLRRQVLPLWNGVLKYSAIRGQIFPNSQTIYDRQQFTPQEHMKDPAAWPEVVGISSNGCNTLCSGPAPTFENARQLLGWWRHCLPAHQCIGIYSAALCMLTGSHDLCGIKAMLLRHFVHAAVPPLHMVVGFTQPHHAHFKVKYWPPKAASAGSTRTRLELTSQHLGLPPFLACLLHNLI